MLILCPRTDRFTQIYIRGCGSYERPLSDHAATMWLNKKGLSQPDDVIVYCAQSTRHHVSQARVYIQPWAAIITCGQRPQDSLSHITWLAAVTYLSNSCLPNAPGSPDTRQTNCTARNYAINTTLRQIHTKTKVEHYIYLWSTSKSLFVVGDAYSRYRKGKRCDMNIYLGYLADIACCGRSPQLS